MVSFFNKSVGLPHRSRYLGLVVRIRCHIICPGGYPMRKHRYRLSRKTFNDLVTKTLETLPEEFLSRLENVVINVEDEPPKGMHDTMGLYEGVPLIDRSLESVNLPDRITLYRGPIERSCSNATEIEAEIRDTVLHEVGHFFGLEEDDLE